MAATVENPANQKVHSTDNQNGIVEEVFHLLWMRDPIFGKSKFPSIQFL